MEALTALSVASSVIQFVDFGSKLLSNTRKLYKSSQGVLTENVDVEIITHDLSSLTLGLRRKLPQNRRLGTVGSDANPASEDDEALDVLCARCVEIAEELMKRLSKLKVKSIEAKGNEGKEGEGEEKAHEEESNLPSPFSKLRATKTRSRRFRTVVLADGSEASEQPEFLQFRRWDSFRKALEASWDKKEIDALATTLREFRSEIEFRTLVSFRGSLKDLAVQQSQTSRQLSHSTKLVLDTFMNGRDDLANQLRLQAQKLLEIQAALKEKELDDAQKMETFLKGELDRVGTFHSSKADPEDHTVEKDAREYQVEEELRLLMIENGLLGSLSFATLTDRQESVEIAYHQTFEWIYQPSEISKAPWSSFINWLRQEDGVYWINGKAGSGKSTLMRYIFENRRTKDELQNWAGSMPVEMCGFFFWNSGDEEQKSQRGFLRSLLFEILNRHRALLSEIMPEVWEIWSARATGLISRKLPLDSQLLPPEPKPWTVVQLLRAFRKLLKTLQNEVKLSLFIDGLHEYGDDYDDILSLLEEFSKSPNLKICLSSRPLMVFERAFAGLPSLKLQNLTHGDISHYVKDRLYRNKYMIVLSAQHAAAVSELVDEIVGKASGVFLWVKLVVKSLLHGLRDHNRISDLQKRVRHLPADLEALYAHMLKHTDPFYDEQASQIFQIMRAAQKGSPDKVTLLTLSWADEEDENLAENAPIRPLTEEEISTRCKTMDARLKSVCAGLLESNDVRFSSIAPNAKVMFMHRTVADWFKKETVWGQLLSRTARTGFSPNLAMLKSCILRLKCSQVSNALPLDTSIIVNALEYAKEAEGDLNCGFPKLLDQLDFAASYQWRVGKWRSGSSSNSRSLDSESEDDVFEDAVSSFYNLSLSPKNASTFHQKQKRIFNSPEDLQEGSLRISFAVPAESSLHHWSYGLEIPGIKPLGQASSFYMIARDIGLSHYVSMKYQSGIIVDQDVNQHLLTQAIPYASGSLSNGNNRAIDPTMVKRALEAGADPNFSYTGATPWEAVLVAAASHLLSYDESSGRSADLVSSEWKQKAEAWAQVFDSFLRHGADPNTLSERHPRLPGHPRLSPWTVVTKYFSSVLPEEAYQLRLLLVEKGVERGVGRGVEMGVESIEYGSNGSRESVIVIDESKSKLRTIITWFWG
ncbi:hypothetical protein BP6252_01860 [Coleophoma cylindrospora]|uniref:Uncharacterized protein n=1 Tax=Coleophoma cylindrospora TaxID=1849047 RepID=A0A3D8SD61_9HELO|nr:hypothetical protein BP6252_01860 [Coleophoma cylindrospora]